MPAWATWSRCLPQKLHRARGCCSGTTWTGPRAVVAVWPVAITCLASVTQPPQMNTPGPAISLRTWFWGLPQNVQDS